MDTLRVPKRAVEVRLLLEGGESLEGELYVPPTGPYGGPGRLIDRLNDEAEAFMPLVSGGLHTHLVSKTRILTLEIAAGQEDHEPIDTFASRELDVTVDAIGGLTLSGRLVFVMPPGQRRTLDFLNAAPSFISLANEDKTTLIRRSGIISVREHEENPTGD